MIKAQEQYEQDFYDGIAKILGIKSNKVRKLWEEGFYEFIVRELYLRGSCVVPLLGKFSMKKCGEDIRVYTKPDGEQIVYRIPERYIPFFMNNDIFINDCNMRGVTNKYRIRLENNALTSADYRRILRANAIDELNDGKFEEESIEESKERFKRLLESKKRKGNKKNDPNSKEE